MSLRILMAVDGSEHSAVVARQVGRLVRQVPGTRVTILHVAHPAAPEARDTLGNPVEVDVPLDVMLRRSAEPVLALAREHLGLPPGDVAEEVTTGENPAAEIVALARADGYDLIAVGTHGHSGWREAILGSVARSVMHTATCPVLVVR